MNDAKFIILFILFLFIFCVLLVFLGLKSEENWVQYKKENNCHESGYMEGSTSLGISANNGSISYFISPKKIRYSCENGLEVYR